ncbi:hypothetical protein AWB76_03279 [Caballeronia temeraria]|uniref:Uncharacterized protein n=1 Tax=Caballeronia temeraria TaxID=1777137 RepID=A0A158AXW5_9BURK|nr:hypothetical protein [Caballeronia temeraria]SAK62615.1 hypothetical protein AWB76_03279 [Caballeronia temeraria]
MATRLPRHLRGKFSDTDGAPILTTDPAGDDATSGTGAMLIDTPDASTGDAQPFDTTGVTLTHVTTIKPDDDLPPGRSADARDVPAEAGSGDANYRRMEGRYKAQIKRLEDRINELTEHARGTGAITDMLMEARRELAELRSGDAPNGASARAAAINEPQVPKLPELTDDELAMYGEFAPVADKLIARAQAPLLAKLAEIERSSGTLGERLGRSEEQRFVDRVGAAVGNMDAITAAPEWQEYLERDIPFAGMKIGRALLDAHTARDLNRITSIFHGFREAHSHFADDVQNATGTNGAVRGMQALNQAQRSGLAQFATPNRTAANGSGTPRPRFKDSDYRNKAAQMRAGRLTKQEFMQFENDFLEAKRAGLVAKN